MGKEKSVEIVELEDELNEIIEKIKKNQEEKADKSLKDACSDMSDAPKVQLKCKRVLRGHLNKVNAVHFSGDSRHLVSGALDSKLIIWDSWSGNKVQIIPLMSSWTMTCAYSPSGNFVACGGMDNMCTIFDINNKDASNNPKIKRELAGYEGFLSSCRFIDDSKVLTGSADMKIILWDLEKNAKISEFHGHSGDVMSLSLSPDLNTFVSGSVDKTAKLWDIRDVCCKQTFWGHESDVNSVCFHNSGHAFASCSDDKSARLFDIRSDQQLASYESPSANGGFTSCALSLSGRYIMC
ncbi:Guanine nucleotide-binding protein subunit beta-2-like protein, partial [Dinothrombium tinctorium]